MHVMATTYGPKRRRGRPATTGKGLPVQIRLHEPMLSALDQEVQRLSSLYKTQASRAMVIRNIVSMYFSQGPVGPDPEEELQSEESDPQQDGPIESYPGDPRQVIEALRNYLLQNQHLIAESGVGVDPRRDSLFLQMMVASIATLRRADETAPGLNALSTLANILSDEFRRQVLLEVLERNGWNLTVVANELRLGGAGNVSTLIRTLDLVPALRAAQMRGLALPGRRGRF
jgi:hypothetical protein